jgi:hypothetical protein
MPVLTSYSAQMSIQALTEHLKPTDKKALEKIVGMLNADHLAVVADVHQALSPPKPNEPLNRDAANKALERLINAFNAAAEEAGHPSRLVIDRNKRGGAERRWIWFEGQESVPQDQRVPELNASRGNVVQGQQAMFLNAPCIVLMTFNEHETRAVLRQGPRDQNARGIHLQFARRIRGYADRSRGEWARPP